MLCSFRLSTIETERYEKNTTSNTIWCDRVGKKVCINYNKNCSINKIILLDFPSGLAKQI